MRRYALSQEAEEDLGDIRAYYLARASARTTRYVMREITKAMGFLASTPGAGHSREDLTDDPVKFWPVFSTRPLSRSASRACCTGARISKPC